MTIEALDAATRAIAEELSVEGVLQLIVDRVRPLVGARYAALGIVDPLGRIERFITAGISQEQRELIGDPPRGHGLLGLIIRENRSMRIADIAVDPNRHGFPPNHPPMMSFLGSPITVKGRTVGNLYLTDKMDAAEFSEADLRLVEMLALHAGIAIDNARLHAEIQRLVVVDERERIGKDLHDGIIQSLYAVGLSLEDVPQLMLDSPDEASARVERAIDSLHHTIRDIRNFIFELQPELLGGATLRGGAAMLVDEFRHSTTIDLELVLLPGDLPEPEPAVTRDVLAILSEALANVARHSQASRADITVRTERGGLLLEIADNGIGFKPGGGSTLGHQGMRNMRERAARVGGELAVTSAPGAGSRVVLTVPSGPAA
jgi:signal transduction histidine kinase